eukprot:2251707-Ditylum_brightwellii.AAC.2
MNMRLALAIELTSKIHLLQYLVRQKKLETVTCTARTIVVAGSPEDKEAAIEQFLSWNALQDEGKAEHPYTGHWYFVPFNPNRKITQAQILSMMEI